MKKINQKTMVMIMVMFIVIGIIIIIFIGKKGGTKDMQASKSDKTTELTQSNTKTEPANQDFKENAFITISEMASDAVILQDVVLTFRENEDFYQAIKEVTVEGKSVEFEKTNGTITIPGDNFRFPVEYEIKVLATNYETSTVYQSVLEKETWELIWNDEFSGDTLDMTKWDYQIGIGSEYGVDYWGNQEAQYYTKENVTVGNGVLKIQAKKDTDTYKDAGTSYTSGRIRTFTKEGEALFATTYGRLEAKIKMPIGEGLWPAFWMLPATNTYTTWAASGEIDIMEARGRLKKEVAGTIHYGEVWPNNKYSTSDYTLPGDSTINEYHIYALEWDVDEIRWLVDGKVYNRTSTWYSKGANEPLEYTYPAPFDEPFYILLNLAVGGTFDEHREPSQEDLPATMEVDYVRVYKKIDGYDTSQVQTQKLDTISFESYPVEEDGSFITDRKYETLNLEPLTTATMDPTSKQWYFLTISDYAGKATMAKEVKDEVTYASIEVTEEGNQDYSVQLIQHLPVANGYSYTIAFDAYATIDREIAVKVSGDGDNNWTVYSSIYHPELTNEPQHFEYTFTMNSKSDPTARLEFNLGLLDGRVLIGNVVVKAGSGDSLDPSMPKAPLASGNYIYNGGFNQGTNRTAFWKLEEAKASVVNAEKELVIEPNEGEEAVLTQSGILLEASMDYTLSFQTAVDQAVQVRVQVTDAKALTIYTEESFNLDISGLNTIKFTMPDQVPEDGVTVRFIIQGGTVGFGNMLLVN